MDPQKFKEAYQRLETLDDRLSHKIRPRQTASMVGTSPEQLDERQRELARFSLELKEILRDLFVAIAARPGGGGPAS